MRHSCSPISNSAAGAVIAALVLAGCGSSGSPSRPTSSPLSSGTPAGSSAPVTPPTVPGTSTPTTRLRSTPSSTPAARSNNQHVAGRVVVLNPGHNGGNAAHTAEIDRLVPAGYGDHKACDTTGTSTDAGYPEHAFTWDLAKRIRALLQRHGVRVVLTRHGDHGVGPCVDERAQTGNRPDVAAVVTLHADGGPSGGRGFHVNQASKRPDGATAKVAHQSDQLGRAIHRALVASSGLVPSTYIGKDGYVYRSDFAGLNLATRPATFLELGNMRNAGDAARLSSGSGRQRIAAAVAAGILTYLADH